MAKGAGTPRIPFREVLPNLWAPILVYATLLFPTFIATEAVLSFLFIPGTVLVIVVVAFNLARDSVRDALDPKVARQ